MHDLQALRPEQLRWRCDPGQFEFVTTAELTDLEGLLGQSRAEKAIEFGIGMRRDGYNLYTLGPPGSGKRTVVHDFLEQHAPQEAVPPDWCYVNNFRDADRPRALRLPAGRGRQLRQDMSQLVDDLQSAIRAVLDSEEHQHRIEDARQAIQQQHDQALDELAVDAREQGLEMVRTPSGVALAPVKDGQVISPDDYLGLPNDSKKTIEQALELLQPRLQEIVKALPRLKKQAREKEKELNRSATKLAIEHLISPLRDTYADLPDVVAYLDAVETDVIEHSESFRTREEDPRAALGTDLREPSCSHYLVNLLVDNAATVGAPIVYEEHPYYQNLIGHVEHRSQMGSLVTDFSLIKAGALHRANGGYLVLQARDMLLQPHAWEGLKRALRSGKIQIESLGAALSLISTVSLEPVPIPLDVKVVLLGDRALYYMLKEHDPDFADLFKVAADFQDQTVRTSETCQLYARVLATQARREQIRPLDAAAVALTMEESARRAGDRNRLSTHLRSTGDLMREADYWAQRDGAEVISDTHVQTAMDQHVYRLDRLRELIQDEFRRGTLLIDTAGERVGQVNGLSVIDLGDFAFGRPSRITATARLGSGKVVDIEREVELGGSLHSKGVLILSSYLAARYAKEQPLSLSASLVFEQSYGIVDGDGASVAELCALLSVLANVPVKQGLAITGSVNQHGEAQPIGGTNEKIEGFFDVCATRGLTGGQGVLIPAANMSQLMLRSDVIEAAKRGEFHVYAYHNVDEAMTLLTGVEAGDLDDYGAFPLDTVNARVDRRLRELSDLHREFAEKGRGLP